MNGKKPIHGLSYTLPSRWVWIITIAVLVTNCPVFPMNRNFFSLISSYLTSSFKSFSLSAEITGTTSGIVLFNFPLPIVFHDVYLLCHINLLSVFVVCMFQADIIIFLQAKAMPTSSLNKLLTDCHSIIHRSKNFCISNDEEDFY